MVVKVKEALSFHVITDTIGDWYDEEVDKNMKIIRALKGESIRGYFNPMTADPQIADVSKKYAESEEWLAIEAKYKPLALDLCRKLAPYADKEVPHAVDYRLAQLVHNLDDSFSAVSDYGYWTVDASLRFLPGIYDIQIGVLNELVEQLGIE
jgi:hypothetical protein